jgi:hypothetical protein
MANLFAIHSVSASLMTYLRNAYPEPLRSDHPCDFRVISSGEIEEPENIGTAVTLYLYRMTIDEHLRNLPAHHRPHNPAHPLSLNLHYLLAVWADSALAEHTIMAWVMSELNQHPVLDSAALSPEAQWRPDDQVHIVPVELSTEDLMRIWDALLPNYRLSISYIARVVRIDPVFRPESEPVVAARYRYDEKNINEGT